jgi:Mg-chelatase subunit ChlD
MRKKAADRIADVNTVTRNGKCTTGTEVSSNGRSKTKPAVPKASKKVVIKVWIVVDFSGSMRNSFEH